MGFLTQMSMKPLLGSSLHLGLTFDVSIFVSRLLTILSCRNRTECIRLALVLVFFNRLPRYLRLLAGARFMPESVVEPITYLFLRIAFTFAPSAVGLPSVARFKSLRILLISGLNLRPRIFTNSSLPFGARV